MNRKLTSWRTAFASARLRSRGLRRAPAFVVAILLSLLLFGVALAQNPVAIQVYFIPLDEDDALVAMKATNSNATAPVYTYVSIAIGSNSSYIYYDHWENGFETDIANPTDLYGPGNPDGTQVWGNGNASDGCAPNRNGTTAQACTNANDVLNAGDVIVLSNPVDPTTLQSVIDYDGGDKIGASRQIAVSRLYWPQVPRTLLAGAIELLPTNKWGTSYMSPVGEGSNTGVDPGGLGEDGDFNDMFEYTSLAIQAFQPGTQVTVDVNGGAPGGVSNYTLQPGQSIVADNVLQSATVEATYPVQVHLLTADRNSSYEHSAYTLVPTADWDSRYFNPVGVTKTGQNPTRKTQLTFFNPTDDLLAIDCEFRDRVADVVVPARGAAILENPDRSGAECRAVTPLNQPFFAIATVDAAGIQGGAGETWDWGFTLIQENQLAPQALVGLGLGRDPTSSSSPNENGSPIWVTPNCGPDRLLNFIFVDFDGDGDADLVDLNGDGDTNDTIDGISESTSNTGMPVTTLKSVRIFDPVDRNQTGARISTRRTADYASIVFGCDIAVVWGADPSVASQGEPGFDVGTSVPPLSSLASVKEGYLQVDADGDGYLTRGDTIGYQIKIENTGIAPIQPIQVEDGLPELTTYVANSTTLDRGSGPELIPDDLAPRTPFPLDEGGIDLAGGAALPPLTEWVLAFSAQVNIEDPAPEECNEFVITNIAIINGGDEVEEVPGFESVDCAGTLVVRKVALGGPPVPSFPFTATAEFFQGGPNNELPSSGTLTPDAFGSDAVTYSVPTGVYTITELLTPGWVLTDIGCEGSGLGNVRTRQATYFILGDDTVRCTFTNTVPAVLELAKVTNPADDPTEFTFEFADLNALPETPEDPSLPAPPTGTQSVLQGGDVVSYTVIAGSYVFTELVPSGWQLTDITCTAGGTPIPAGNAARYDVAPGQTTRCTFTNTQDATITLQKFTLPPGSSQTFGFTGALTASLGDGDAVSRTVAPGTHVVNETPVPGWQLDSGFCDDGDSSVASPTITFVADAGESVVCTVYNLQLASVGDFVWNDLNANGIQNAGEPGLGGVTVRLYQLPANPEPPTAAGTGDVLIGTQTTNGAGNYLFSNLPPGAYYLLFATPAGKFISPQEVGADRTIDSDIDATGRTANFTLSPGARDLTRDAGFWSQPTTDDGVNEPAPPIFLPLVLQ